jgi:hypothetical protein
MEIRAGPRSRGSRQQTLEAGKNPLDVHLANYEGVSLRFLLIIPSSNPCS